MVKYLTRPGLVPDGFTANMVRYPIAAAVYLPWLIISIRNGLGRFWIAALLPASFNIVAQALFGAAPYYMDASLMAFLSRLCVVWSILGAFWLFPEERRLAGNPRFWMGAGLAIVGFIVMSTLGLRIGTGITIAGVLIIFFCSLTYSMYELSVRYVIGNIHALRAFAIISAYTSIGLIGLAPLGRPEAVLHLPRFALILLIVSAIIGIGCAHGLYYIAVKRLGVAVCSLFLMVTPFVSLFCASIFLGERLSLGQLIGGVLLTFGSMLAIWTHQHLPRDTSYGSPDTLERESLMPLGDRENSDG